jgi:hypothetical protein
VLLQLSKRGFEKYKNDILLYKLVRSKLQQPGSETGDDTAKPDVDGANMLFYYLFEDYSGAVPALGVFRENVKAIVSSATTLRSSNGGERLTLARPMRFSVTRSLTTR